VVTLRLSQPEHRRTPAAALPCAALHSRTGTHYFTTAFLFDLRLAPPPRPCLRVYPPRALPFISCVAAVNGGFFTWSKGWLTPIDQRCSLGVLVCNGSTWSSAPSPQPVFAMTSSCDMYVGNFPYSHFASVSVVNAVSGSAVIVLNGTVQPRPSSAAHHDATPPKPHSAFPPRSSYSYAPRTALGHDASGRIMTLQVDGDESENTGAVCSPRVCAMVRARRSLFAGATVAEMADLMAAAGAWSAIALDGGGSSTTVML
jgi:exopolysaccharide biosynthesis protein